MFTEILHWDILKRIILNTVFVSIPEEIFLVMFTLILLGEFDFWKEKECRKLFDSWDYVRVFVPVVISSVVSNMLRYLGIDVLLVSAATVFLIFLLIVLTGDVWRDASALKWILKAFVFLMLGIIITFTIESIYIPFILYATVKSLEDINKNILLNIIISLPVRLAQHTILSFLFTKKRISLKVSIIKEIFQSKTLTALSILLLVSNVVFLLILVKAVSYEKVLLNLSIEFRLMILLGICTVPFLSVVTFLLSIWYIKDNENQKQKNVVERLKIITKDIKLYTNNGKYDNIRWKMNEVEKSLEEIVTNLQAEPKINKRR